MLKYEKCRSNLNFWRVFRDVANPSIPSSTTSAYVVAATVTDNDNVGIYTGALEVVH